MNDLRFVVGLNLGTILATVTLFRFGYFYLYKTQDTIFLFFSRYRAIYYVVGFAGVLRVSVFVSVKLRFVTADVVESSTCSSGWTFDEQ